ncbi:MAG: thioredoxin domain-containing protein [Gammaproteobacteria bacterium]
MNALQHQKSTYLSQHRDDPVNWQPWGPEAIALAKKKNRPILLSIGYSSSHLCKVMTRESFTSNQIAKLINNQYVPILVDREELRDVDRLYQAAHRLLTRSGGGWPLTLFIDPNDLLPFYSGTYFPAQANETAPAFREVINRMAETYESQFEKIQEFKSKLEQAIVKSIGGGEPGEIEQPMVDPACAQIDSSFDEKYGGFEQAPKSPHPSGLEFLREALSHINNDQQYARAAHMLDFTLANLSVGGMHDHVGGGFFGYSSERDWSIPRFEKTLCDNGQLLSVFSARAKETNYGWFKHVAYHTADWMIREMRLENGGFATSLDSESNDTEGRYYTWSKDEVKAVLDDDASDFSFAFGLDKSANFRGKWHLRCSTLQSLDEMPTEDDINRYKDYFPRLMEARLTRHAPVRDETVVTAWNALAIKGLVDLANYFNREDCLGAALSAIDFLREAHWNNKDLAATSHNSKIGVPGYLDDYAFLLQALVSIDQSMARTDDLDFAIEIADVMVAKFYDDDNGGFFFTPTVEQAPISRIKTFADDWFPAGNAVASMALLSLAARTGNSDYQTRAEATLKAGMGDTKDWPSAHATMVRALTRLENM